MGDVPSSNVIADDHPATTTTTIMLNELEMQIEEMRQQYETLEVEKRQWQRKRRALWEQSSSLLVGSCCISKPITNGGSHKNVTGCGVPQKENDEESLSVQDHMQIILEAARYRQQEALDDFRSTLAQRKSLEETSKLARESKALYDAFHIGYQGPFATINGLRLGAEATIEEYRSEDPRGRGMNGDNNIPTTSTIKVPWSEINSALGLLALLLSCLEQKPHAGIRYRHEIVCCGSTSRIGVGRRRNNNNHNHSSEDDRTTTTTAPSAALTYYNLFSDDSFQFFGRRNFNTALQCLVQCVVDAADAIQRRDPTIHLPHPIVERAALDVTVGGLSVVYGGANGVEWTRAMKYLLTNVKHLTAYRAFGLWDVVLDK